MATYNVAVVDKLVSRTSATYITASGVQLGDRIILSQPKPAATYRARVKLAVPLKLKAVASPRGLYHYLFTSTIRFGSRTTSGALSIVLVSALTFRSMVKGTTMIKLTEALELSARLGVRGLFARQVADRLVAADNARQGWYKRIADRITATGRAASTYKANLAIHEEITLTAARSVKMIVQVAVADDIAIDDGIGGLRALYRQALVEVLDFGIEIEQPDGTTTAWTVNARTGAVSEYQDYMFNSFMEMGDGTYVGAGEDGNLYLMQGPDDNGGPIIADLVGGMLDMGGSRFTQLKAVYLGMRSTQVGSKFYLKLITNAGTIRTYEVRVMSDKTARVDIGKGLRTKYVQWELISTGQGFDLQSIEFVPLISTRRI